MTHSTNALSHLTFSYLISSYLTLSYLILHYLILSNLILATTGGATGEPPNTGDNVCKGTPGTKYKGAY